MYSDMAGYSSPWWGTYNQIAALGGQVRKGEHGSTIVLYKTFVKTETDAKTGEEVDRRIPLMRAFVVFNAAQADGLPERYTAPVETVTNEHDRIEVAEQVVAEYVGTGAGPRLDHGGDQACYSPLLDLVKILGVVLDTVWSSRSSSRSWQDAARINVSENQDLHLALRWF
jgi:antirestriction protein ArdC